MKSSLKTPANNAEVPYLARELGTGAIVLVTEVSDLVVYGMVVYLGHKDTRRIGYKSRFGISDIQRCIAGVEVTLTQE